MSRNATRFLDSCTRHGEIAEIRVNGQAAALSRATAGVADWEISVILPPSGMLVAQGTDDAGNVELTPHELRAISGNVAVSSR